MSFISYFPIKQTLKTKVSDARGLIIPLLCTENSLFTFALTAQRSFFHCRKLFYRKEACLKYEDTPTWLTLGRVCQRRIQPVNITCQKSDCFDVNFDKVSSHFVSQISFVCFKRIACLCRIRFWSFWNHALLCCSHQPTQFFSGKSRSTEVATTARQRVKSPEGSLEASSPSPEGQLISHKPTQPLFLPKHLALSTHEVWKKKKHRTFMCIDYITGQCLFGPH